MRIPRAAFYIPVLTAALAASSPAQSPASQTDQPSPTGPRLFTSPLGFSFQIPPNWQALDSQPVLPDLKEERDLSGSNQADAKGVACTQLGLTARQTSSSSNPTSVSPASVMVEVALPFNCFGRRIAANDLPAFGAGATQGIKQDFDLATSHQATYTLGSHPVWAERVEGSPKGAPKPAAKADDAPATGDPAPHTTIEIACTLLSQAAVCWLTEAADSASLASFEQLSVTLDGDAPLPLVPAGTFPK